MRLFEREFDKLYLGAFFVLVYTKLWNLSAPEALALTRDILNILLGAMVGLITAKVHGEDK